MKAEENDEEGQVYQKIYTGAKDMIKQLRGFYPDMADAGKSYLYIGNHAAGKVTAKVTEALNGVETREVHP